MARDVAQEFPMEEVMATSARATVYRSTNARTGDVVAVKVVNTAGTSIDQAQRQRYLRTMDAVKSLQLKGFPRVIAFGFSTDENAFMVMEFVDGEKLGNCKGASPALVLGLLGKVVDTLEITARSGVCHNNLNPENILVVKGGAREEVRLTGLGTAVFFDQGASGKSLASANGNEAFVAPERLQQSLDTGSEEWRSDLFSFARTAVEVLGGTVDGVGGTDPSVNLPVEVLREAADAEKLNQALAAALRGDPGQRRIGWVDFHQALGVREQEQAVQEIADPPRPGQTILMPLADLLSKSAEPDTTVSTETEAYDVRRPPVAVDDSFETNEGSILKVPPPGVLVNDSDPNDDPLTAIEVKDPKHGTLALKRDGSFSYAPDSGFDGADSFSYKANNGFQDSNTATVVITVNRIVRPPKAVDVAFATEEGRSLEVSAPGVLENDIDHEGLPLKAIVVAQPRNGTLSLASDGSFVYEPPPGFAGTDTFAYRASNGLVASSPATVTLTVKKIERRFVTPAPTKSHDETTKPRQTPLSPPDERVDRKLTRSLKPPPLPPVAKIEPATAPLADGGSRLKPPPIPSIRTAPTPETPTPEPPPMPVSDELPISPPGPISVTGMLKRMLVGPWTYLIGGIAFVVVVIITLVVLWPDPTEVIQPEIEPTVAAPTRVPTPIRVPTEIPAPVFHSGLEAAERALLAGDTGLARSELEVLTENEISEFSEEEAGLYDHLMVSIGGGQRDQAIKDLRGGLAYSSMKMIRRALVGLSGLDREEVAAVPGLARDIRRGQEAVQVYSLMERSRREGNQVLVLEYSTSMLAMLPEYSTAHQWREEAAAGLEIDAEALAANGQYERAITHLEPLTRLWSDRPGLQDRLGRYRVLRDEDSRQRAEEQTYGEFLDAAIERGRSGAPEEGLQMLSRQNASPALEQKRRQAITELETLLAELDALPPTIVIVPNTEFSYQKNQPFTINCRMSDDHRVVTAKAMLRTEGSTQYREIPLAGPAGDRYSIEVGPDLHRNSTVEIYFEARDVSGHVGRLGSASEPLVFARKRFFKRIRGN